MWEYNYTDELYHYGRKGMKWGKKIFSKESAEILSTSSKGMKSGKELVDAMPTPKRKRMDLSHMSDKEIQDKINRELKEIEYNRLFSKPSRAEKGKKVASSIFAGLGATLSMAASAVTIGYLVNEMRKGNIPKPGK